MSKSVAVAMLCIAGVLPALASEKFFKSGGVRIRYLDEGRGEPLVLLHGSGGSADDFEYAGVIRALKKEYRILALDARAHGQSGQPHEVAKYGLEMVEDVVRLLDRLAIPRAHVLGFSMGARITAKLMVTHPDRLQSVLLVGGGARRDTPEERRRLEEQATGYEKGTILVQAWPADNPPRTIQEARALSDAYLKQHDRLALAALTRGRVQFFVTADELRASEVPAIGIAGSADGALNELRRTAADKRGMAIVEIDGAGHTDAIARPEFVRAVRTFLAAHRLAR